MVYDVHVKLYPPLRRLGRLVGGAVRVQNAYATKRGRVLVKFAV